MNIAYRRASAHQYRIDAAVYFFTGIWPARPYDFRCHWTSVSTRPQPSTNPHKEH